VRPIGGPRKIASTRATKIGMCACLELWLRYVVVLRNRKGIFMLPVYVPALIADAMLELCFASLSVWQLMSGDPIVVIMADELIPSPEGCR
jgi:ABC-type spermidine/putrescine transport system permease subunit II